MQEITILLGELSEGRSEVIDRLMPLVYKNLQVLARRNLRNERPHHTLDTTALVHEAYLKLVDQKKVNWQNRAHFYAIAAQAMRRILINYAQKRLAEKRGGGQALITFNEQFMYQEARAEELLALDEVLAEFANINIRQARVVEFRFFGGLTYEEIALVLGVSVPTVRRDWRLARAYLTRELKNRDS